MVILQRFCCIATMGNVFGRFDFFYVYLSLKTVHIWVPCSTALATFISACGNPLVTVFHKDETTSHLSQSRRARRYGLVASSPGPTKILSRSRGEKSGEGLGAKLRHDWKWWLVRNVDQVL